MDISDLNAQFAIPGVLHFDLHGELTRALITLPSCAATLYLQGAHLTHWQPAAEQPVLFLSAKSDFAPGKPIRGGVPICFPWFGPREEGKPGPTHGFARIQPWSVAAAALLPGESGALHLTLTLSPTDISRSLGFDHFRAAYEVILGKDAGRALTLRLSVANLGDTPFRFEQALHTYFAIGDIHQVQLTGLESAPYIDKRDAFRVKSDPPGPLSITTWTDRIFPASTGPVSIHDAASHRTLTNTKTHSASTVVWNAWSDGVLTLPDMSPGDWLKYIAVETANVGADAVTLAPREARTMETVISLHRA